MRAALAALCLATVICSAGCGKKPAPTAPGGPPPDPIPPMSRFDTLLVVLADDGYTGAPHRWTITSQYGSITLPGDADTTIYTCDGSGSNCVWISPAAIIYDTRDSLRIRIEGWESGFYYNRSHQIDSTLYVKTYPPQDSTWRLPNAPVDPCKRVPTVLLFSQGRTDYQQCNVQGDCYWDYTLYAYCRAYHWDTDRSWPPTCSPLAAIVAPVRDSERPLTSDDLLRRMGRPIKQR